VKPPRFEYVAPATLEEALAIRAETGRGSVVVLAGGQSLIPTLNLRIAQPDLVLDLNGVPGLDRIEEDDGGLVLGALVRQRAAERSELVQRHCPLLPEALAHVAHPAIRTRGTLGGSIAYADPGGEIPTVAIALDATLVLRSSKGARLVPAREFALAPYMTVLEPDEILLEIRIPHARGGTAFLEVSRRHGDSALAGVAATVAVTDGVVQEARIAFLGAGPTPARAEGAEAALAGAEAGPKAFDAAAAEAASGLETHSDHHGTAAYRRHLARTLAARALALAASRASA
jgi:aerobic carbon-monoxide dehydrogenase medium subunit